MNKKKYRVNKIQNMNEAYPGELVDEIRDDIVVDNKKVEIECLSCENSTEASPQDIQRYKLKKCLVQVLALPEEYVLLSTKEWLLNQKVFQDILGQTIVEEERRLLKLEKDDNPIKIKNGKIFKEE